MNLGNPGEFTIKQLAEEVIKTCESKSGFTYLPLPADDPRQRKPDITRRRPCWAGIRRSLCAKV